MGASPLDGFLESVEPGFRELVRAAHAAVMDSGAELDVAIKYRMLMYTLNGDWRHWVCAVSQTKDAVNLRFLYGVGLGDPAGVLRAGTSTLMTVDFASMDDFDPAMATSYVAEAVGIHERYRDRDKD